MCRTCRRRSSICEQGTRIATWPCPGCASPSPSSGLLPLKLEGASVRDGEEGPMSAVRAQPRDNSERQAVLRGPLHILPPFDSSLSHCVFCGTPNYAPNRICCWRILSTSDIEHRIPYIRVSAHHSDQPSAPAHHFPPTHFPPAWRQRSGSDIS